MADPSKPPPRRNSSFQSPEDEIATFPELQDDDSVPVFPEIVENSPSGHRALAPSTAISQTRESRELRIKTRTLALGSILLALISASVGAGITRVFLQPIEGRRESRGPTRQQHSDSSDSTDSVKAAVSLMKTPVDEQTSQQHGKRDASTETSEGVRRTDALPSEAKDNELHLSTDTKEILSIVVDERLN